MSDDLPCLPCPMTSDDFRAARKNGKRLACERMYDEMVELRELVRDLYTTVSWCDLDVAPSDAKKREFANRARELGIEVGR